MAATFSVAEQGWDCEGGGDSGQPALVPSPAGEEKRAARRKKKTL